jgi:hypothetical protein
VILPAFSKFTGLAFIPPDSGDIIYAIANNKLERMGTVPGSQKARSTSGRGAGYTVKTTSSSTADNPGNK